jgi:hypothetical protein
MKVNEGSFKKGQHYSLETEFKKYMSPWNYGTPVTEETKIKISLSNKGKLLGKLHWNWQGGPKDYGITFNLYLKEYIRYRDNYQCKICGILQSDCKNRLSCHHIDYDKKNCDPTNLISLCSSCHMKTNFNREYWKVYFKEVICHIV